MLSTCIDQVWCLNMKNHVFVHHKIVKTFQRMSLLILPCYQVGYFNLRFSFRIRVSALCTLFSINITYLFLALPFTLFLSNGCIIALVRDVGGSGVGWREWTHHRSERGAGLTSSIHPKKIHHAHTQMWDLNGMRYKLSDVHGHTLCFGWWYRYGQYLIILAHSEKLNWVQKLLLRLDNYFLINRGKGGWFRIRDAPIVFLL